jgi:hypothetical protein
VKQTKQDTFVHQGKYTKDLMKKFNMTELKPVSTLMSSAASLGLDEDSDAVDQREYRSMIGSLLYLTATRPDIQFLSRWILLVFLMLILRVVGLTERALLGLAIFLELLSFASLLGNSLQLHCPPLRPSM